jgi:hypothetical protein
MTLKRLGVALLLSCFALPARAQFGLSSKGYEGLHMSVRPLGGKFNPEGGQGNENALAGVPGSNVPIDGFTIRYYRGTIDYQAKSAGAGWGAWTKEGEPAGVSGKKLEGIRVRVERGSIHYRVAQVGGDFGEWKKDGETAEVAPGQAIEAIETEYLNSAREGQSFEYRVSFKGSGFTPWAAPGEPIEGSGPDAEIDGIEFRKGGGISCEAALLNRGWRPAVTEGKTCGDTTDKLRFVAFRLVSPIPVRYRAKIEGLGWSTWAHDLEGAGIIGGSRRMQGVQIQPTPQDE